jgi:hypothetical protein
MPAEEDIPVDTDKDGIPDDWEDANDLDKNNEEDGKIITADGYSNLEHYLNSDIPYIQSLPDSSSSKLNELQASSFNLYPIPVIDILNFDINTNINFVEIFSIEGKLIKQTNIGAYDNSLNLSDLDSGIYTIKLYLEEGKNLSQRIIKN